MDGIIYNPFGGLASVAYHVAEKLQLPCCALHLYPARPTRDFPSPYAPPGWHLGSAYNLLTHVGAEQVSRLASRAWVDRWRVDTLQLPSLPLKGFFHNTTRRRVPQLFGFSPSVVPKPSDWKDWQHVTGYWFLDEAEAWEPPDGLAEFLRTGPPPVYIGFGSMVDARPEELSEIIGEALSSTGRRAVVGEGWGRMRCDLENVYHIGWVPFRRLLPHVAAAVHHAGTGTAAEALRSGTPSVAVPFFGEQRFWAARLHELGVAPAPIPRRELTAKKLAAAIEAAAGDAEIHARAARLGECIRAEDGVGEAVRVINHYFLPQSAPAPTPDGEAKA